MKTFQPRAAQRSRAWSGSSAWAASIRQQKISSSDCWGQSCRWSCCSRRRTDQSPSWRNWSLEKKSERHGSSKKSPSRLLVVKTTQRKRPEQRGGTSRGAIDQREVQRWSPTIIGLHRGNSSQVYKRGSALASSLSGMYRQWSTLRLVWLEWTLNRVNQHFHRKFYDQKISTWPEIIYHTGDPIQ